MPRPQPIKYTLKEWTITYSSQYYESSRATGTLYYKAMVIWESETPNKEKLLSNNVGTFRTFDEAKEWIDKEIA